MDFGGALRPFFAGLPAKGLQPSLFSVHPGMPSALLPRLGRGLRWQVVMMRMTPHDTHYTP